MSTFSIIVDKDLEDLIPSFLSNRTKDIITMKEALETRNFEQIRIIGHSMKGFGSGYGFDYVSDAGKILEVAAKESNAVVIQETILKLEDYFANIKISFE